MVLSEIDVVFYADPLPTFRSAPRVGVQHGLHDIDNRICNIFFSSSSQRCHTSDARVLTLELEVAQLFKNFNITRCFQFPILTGVLLSFYPTVQGSGRSPSSLLCTSPLNQTIREFGNHCLWFRTSVVRECDDFLTSER